MSDASDRCACAHERDDHDQGEGREGCQVVVSMRSGHERCSCPGFHLGAAELGERDRAERDAAAEDAGMAREERWYALHDGWVR